MLLTRCPSFFPSSTHQTARGVARMAVNEILGADVETGGVWDPLKFSKDEGSLYRYRAVGTFPPPPLPHSLPPSPPVLLLRGIYMLDEWNE